MGNEHKQDLTERQTSILNAMSDGNEYTLTLIATKLALIRSSLEAKKIPWNIERLIYRGMIEVVSWGTNRVFAITSHGKSALRSEQTQQRLYGGVVAPARLGLLADRSPYVPPKAYYRNSGHHDIQSRGVRC